MDRAIDLAVSIKGLPKRFEKTGPMVVGDISSDIRSGTILAFQSGRA